MFGFDRHFVVDPLKFDFSSSLELVDSRLCPARKRHLEYWQHLNVVSIIYRRDIASQVM